MPVMCRCPLARIASQPEGKVAESTHQTGYARPFYATRRDSLRAIMLHQPLRPHYALQTDNHPEAGVALPRVGFG